MTTVWATGSILHTKRKAEDVLRINWMKLVLRLDISKKIIGPNSTANRHVGHQPSMQYNYCMSIHIWQLLFTHYTTQSWRLNFVNWYLHGVHTGELDHTLYPFSDKAWLHVSEYVNFQRNSFITLIHKVSFRDKASIWCAESNLAYWAHFFPITINLHRCVTYIHIPFFENLSNYEKTFTFSQQDSRKPHTTILCIVYRVLWWQ
jgi:hypothetical protein